MRIRWSEDRDHSRAGGRSEMSDEAVVRYGEIGPIHECDEICNIRFACEVDCFGDALSDLPGCGIRRRGSDDNRRQVEIVVYVASDLGEPLQRPLSCWRVGSDRRSDDCVRIGACDSRRHCGPRANNWLCIDICAAGQLRDLQHVLSFVSVSETSILDAVAEECAAAVIQSIDAAATRGSHERPVLYGATTRRQVV